MTQYPVPMEGENPGLVTKLVHAETGQFQASLAVIPLAKIDPQGMGSAFTYGRRYALSSMLGIICEAMTAMPPHIRKIILVESPAKRQKSPISPLPQMAESR